MPAGRSRVRFGVPVGTAASMRRRRLRRGGAAAAAGALAAGALLAAAGPASAAPETTYYLALGDSLSTGYQPTTQRDEDIAYTDVLYNELKADHPGLVLKKMGCDGETSTTMVEGGHCDEYKTQSQLDAAVQFIEEHPGQIAFVTNDIGANDVFPCVSGGGAGGGGSAATASSGSADSGSAGSAMVPMVGCITDALGTIRTNLATIDSRIHEAGGDDPVYVGMTYYNPVLAGWTQGGMQQALAAATVPANNVLSALITSTNAAHGWATADVTAAFDTNDFSGAVDVAGIGTVPVNVSRICEWTWMCTKGDIHANETGHQKIAAAFLPLMTGEGGTGSLGSAGSLGSLGSAGSVAAGPSGSIGSLGSVRGLAGLTDGS